MSGAETIPPDSSSPSSEAVCPACCFTAAPVTSSQPHTLIKPRQDEGIKYPYVALCEGEKTRLEIVYMKAIYEQKIS